MLWRIIGGAFLPFLIISKGYILLIGKRDHCSRCGARAWWFKIDNDKSVLGGIESKAALVCLSCTPAMCTECGRERAIRPWGYGPAWKISGKFFRRKSDFRH